MAIKITCVVNDIAIENTRLQSEHGLSFWIETPQGIAMLDTGQSSGVLSNNLRVLGLDPRKVQALALSHAHLDHTGGLPALLEANPNVRIFAHPDIFQPRFSLKNGEYKRISLTEDLEGLLKKADLRLSASPVEILPGLWTTGEIRRRQEPEGRSSNHFIRSEGAWVPDPYRDDISLVYVREEGLTVICGCCHAGLLNTLQHVKKSFDQPVTVVMGGTHLLAAERQALEHLKNRLNAEFPDIRFHLNHCTGESAIRFLAEQYGARVAPFYAGMTTVIDL